MRWINLVGFTVILSIVSLMMMRKIRLRFDSLYTEFGCRLRTVYIAQWISIMLLAVLSLIDYFKGTLDLIDEANTVMLSVLRVFTHIILWIIPMITQLSCLIFGYIRDTNPNSKHVRPEYITYFDPIVEYDIRN